MGLGGFLLDLAGAGSLIFRPPAPTYTVAAGPDGLALVPSANARWSRKFPACVVARLQTARGGSLIAALVEHQAPAAAAAPFSTAASAPFAAAPGRPTILLSHGTAVDLGRVLLYYSEVARDLRCNLCVYDYSGYGASAGSFSVPNTIADVDAVFTWLTQQRGVRAEDIVLYGQSLGSGPTVDLASRHADVAGVVLHAAFASCMRQLRPGTKYWPAWFDIYPNSELLPRVTAPVCILHGTRDSVVDVEAGRLLLSLARKPAEPYFPPCKHEDVELSAGYVPHLRRFLESIFGAAYGRHQAMKAVQEHGDDQPSPHAEVSSQRHARAP